MNVHARLAASLRGLETAKKADELFRALPVMSIDEWAVQHDPDLIAEAEVSSGVLHWTNRARTEFAPLPDEDNNRPPDLVDLYPRGISEYHRAMDRLNASTLRHHTKETVTR